MQSQPTGPYTAGQYFKSLIVLCYALVGGIVMFAVIVTVLVMQGIAGHNMGLKNIAFIGVALVLSVAGGIGSYVMYDKMLASVKAKDNLKDMLNTYRAAVITRLALLEGPALFTIIVFFLTGQYYMLALVSILVAIMLYTMPFKQKVIDALQPSSQQLAILNDDDAVIE